MSFSIADAAAAAVLGYAVVFFGLILLMGVITLTGKIMTGRAQAAKTAPAAPAPVPAKARESKVEVVAPAAPGSAGKVMLFDVPDKEAAMIMAIVANKTGKPLNELRFRSIKEVKK